MLKKYITLGVAISTFVCLPVESSSQLYSIKPIDFGGYAIFGINKQKSIQSQVEMKIPSCFQCGEFKVLKTIDDSSGDRELVKFQIKVVAREDLLQEKAVNVSMEKVLENNNKPLFLDKKVINLPEEMTGYRGRNQYKEIHKKIEEYTKDESLSVNHRLYEKGKKVTLYGRALFQDDKLSKIKLDTKLPDTMVTAMSLPVNSVIENSQEYIKKISDFYRSKIKIKGEIIAAVKLHESNKLKAEYKKELLKKREVQRQVRYKKKLLAFLNKGNVFEGTLKAPSDKYRSNNYKVLKTSVKILVNEMDGDYFKIEFRNNEFPSEKIRYGGEMYTATGSKNHFWVRLEKGTGTGDVKDKDEISSNPYFYNGRIASGLDRFSEVYGTVYFEKKSIRIKNSYVEFNGKLKSAF